MSYNFLIIGGDRRLSILAKKLLKDGNKVETYGNEVENIKEIENLEDLEENK